MFVAPDSLLSDAVQQINNRCSWRRYTSAQISSQLLEQLDALITIINEYQHNFKIIRLTEAGNLLSPLYVQVIRGATNVIVFEVLNENRPLVDIQMGCLGELLVLQMTRLGLSTVWLGGDKFCFSSSDIKKRVGTQNSIPICIPFGYPVDPKVDIRKRKPQKDVAPEWTGSEEVFQLINRAPSAVNKQPYQFQQKGNKIHIIPKDKSTNEYMSNWLDSGIAAAHALLAMNLKQITVTENEVIIE
ncbi:Putative_TM nitroreductase [Hexamita inflata]|uniref:TM nitroreductase n=1 Tax=Hexamita inflata TaxID=28002 RepID=A0AA86Q3B5_9EUKA|nr:Putative TM nitroreductase [Hexamita inflata]